MAGYKEIDLGGARKSEEQVLGSMYTNFERRMQALLAKTNLPETDARRIAPENLRAERIAAEKEFRVYADAIAKKELGEGAWKTLGKGDGILTKMKTMESEAAKEVEEKIAAFKIKNKTPQVEEFQAELRARFKSSGRVSAIEGALEYCGKQIEEKGWTMSRVETYLLANNVVSQQDYQTIMEIAKKSGIATDEAFKDVLVFIAPTPETAKLPWKQRYPNKLRKALSFDLYDVADAAGAAKAGAGKFIGDAEYRAELGRAAKRKLLAVSGGGVLVIGAGAFILYKIFSSGEKPPASTTTTTAVPVIKDTFKDVADELKVPKGRRMDLLFEGKLAENYARTITAEGRKLAPGAEEQKRIFSLVQKMYTLNPGFKELVINNTLPIENVPALVSALYELQKCKLPVEQLAGIAANIAVCYSASSYLQMSKDIAVYLSNNPKMARQTEAVSSDPAKFNAAFGKILKHAYTPSLIWSRRPFEAFLSEEEPRFSAGQIKDVIPALSAKIRAAFNPEDQEEIAKRFASMYKGATRAGKPAEIDNEYADHVKFLKQIRDKGFSVEDSFRILLLVVKNVATVSSEAGPYSNLGAYSKPVVLGRLLEGITGNKAKTWGEVEDEIEARLIGILKDSPKNWTMKAAPLFYEVEVTPLMNFLDGTNLNNRQKAAAIDAVKKFFNPEFQSWLLEGVVPSRGAPEGLQLAQVSARLTPSMPDNQIVDEIHALGFERARNWTSEGWNAYLDPEINQYFEETDPNKTGAAVARRQHMALTNAQYLEERKLLIDFANEWKTENRTGAIPPALLLAKAKQAFLIEREAATRDSEYSKKLELMAQSVDSKELDDRVKSIETGKGEMEAPKPKGHKHRRHG